MTAINIATQIPSQITTLEQLIMWGMMGLNACNPTLTVIEGVGYTERAAQQGIFWVGADSKYRGIYRASLEISSNHLSGGGKLWQYAQPLSSTALPTAFSAN
ncbi:glucose-6-phosphate dehydrogenase [Nostoc sp. FACHB-973]|nr:glucose-6-phosphate dehydrogenase [Nostoc sp. FACHB-973]